jgi:Domain of unknown function (DUF4416)
MGIPKEPKPVKYFVAFLTSEPDLLDTAEKDLTAIFGAVENRSEIIPWNLSNYYEREMGCGLLRRFVSFEPLASPEKLVEVKLATQQIETAYRRNTADQCGRRLNLDPGYIESGKVVLATTKNANHRIYLRCRIYAEVTLQFYNGSFHGSPHTYQD